MLLQCFLMEVDNTKQNLIIIVYLFIIVFAFFESNILSLSALMANIAHEGITFLTQGDCAHCVIVCNQQIDNTLKYIELLFLNFLNTNMLKYLFSYKTVFLKCAMQRDFDDLILASPIFIFGSKLFLLFSSKECHNFI